MRFRIAALCALVCFAFSTPAYAGKLNEADAKRYEALFASRSGGPADREKRCRDALSIAKAGDDAALQLRAVLCTTQAIVLQYGGSTPRYCPLVRQHQPLAARVRSEVQRERDQRRAATDKLVRALPARTAPNYRTQADQLNAAKARDAKIYDQENLALKSAADVDGMLRYCATLNM
jgi:hypothetical protein